MKFQLDIPVSKPAQPIEHTHKIMLIGSCFTEHMAGNLAQHRFDICSNPNGILFNPLSVAVSIENYIQQKQYQKEELFYLNELWNSWDHHSRFSDTNIELSLAKINEELAVASNYIATADWLIITLGSAFQYYLKEENKAVANNHRAPAQWFEKRLLSVDSIVEALKSVLIKLQQQNPKVNVLFTISPVRHIRDGLVENNRSKARLIESVHLLCEQMSNVQYFPAYELVIDVLRDYRFYDVDLVHPNFAATSYVWERFVQSFIDAPTQQLMKELNAITIAENHRPRFPDTQVHKDFCAKNAASIKELMQQYPHLKLNASLAYFEKML